MALTITEYVGNRYGPINRVLNGLADLEPLQALKRRAPTAENRARVVTLQKRRRADYNTMLNEVASLDRELTGKARVAAGTVVYRDAGMAQSYSRLDGLAYVTGDLFSQGAYLSTSFSDRYINMPGEGKLRMRITCATRSRAHDIRNAADILNGVAGEQEALFERSTRFLIKRVSAGVNPLWDMVELTDS